MTGADFLVTRMGYTNSFDEVKGFGEAAARNDAIPPAPLKKDTP